MKQSLQRGFSLAEALIVVAVIGILAAIGTITVSNLVSSARDQKLFSDVATINRGVTAFLASGGDLSNVESPDQVLKALKKSVASASRIPGFTGGKVDERLTFTLQSSVEAKSKQWRAYWNGAEKRFVLSESGEIAGIKSFGFDDSTASDADATLEVTAPVLYAEKSTWIWDYEDGPPTTGAVPTSVPLSEVPDTPPATPSGPGPSASSTIPLTVPQFSIASGAYPVTSFDLPLSLTNPNPAGSSDLYYSIDFGSWKPYTGTFYIPPGAIVAAQAIAASETYVNSAKVDQTYSAIPADLLPPLISPSRPEFGLFTNRTLTVSLADQNSSAISKLQYRIGGDPWQEYTAPFSIIREDYPSGALVQARAVPLDPHYITSTATLRTLGIETAMITGTSAGSFSDPIGEAQMETNLDGNLSSDYFAWGNDQSQSGSASYSKSWLDYGGLGFSNIVAGNRFEIGLLNYYNGTIRSNTGANAVSFAVDLNLSINGTSASSTLDFDLDLVNVVNKGKDPWEDADFVRLANPVASKIVQINGVEFQLQLEFGETSPSGISYFDEFHVLENERASTKIYGTLIEVGTTNFNR